MAQSDTRPGLFAGFWTATPLAHCSASVSGAGVAVGVGVGAGVGGISVDVGSGAAGVGTSVDGAGVGSGVEVVAQAPVVSSEIAAANASGARAVGVVIARLEMVFPCSLGLGQECSLDGYGGVSRL